MIQNSSITGGRRAEVRGTGAVVIAGSTFNTDALPFLKGGSSCSGVEQIRSDSSNPPLTSSIVAQARLSENPKGALSAKIHPARSNQEQVLH